MGDATPLIFFILATVLINVFLFQAYDAFDLEVQNSTLSPAGQQFLTTVDTIYDLMESVAGALPLIDDIMLSIIETAHELIVIWVYLPSALFYILFLPMVVGAIYAMIQLFPFT